MWGSGGELDGIRFIGLPKDVPATSIDWRPNTKTRAGYVWVPNDVLLTRDGTAPRKTITGTWDDEPDTPGRLGSRLGYCLPLPPRDFGHCSCGREQGCEYCRLRLQLPFWVHNTTLDEVRTYRVSLFFWTKQQIWRSIAATMPPAGTAPGLPSRYPAQYKNMPGPGPGESFQIEATLDTTPGPAGRDHPWNCQPIAWYVDLHRDQLELGGLHGIKLVLTCVDTCAVQDVKQLWFRMENPVY